MNPRPDLHLVAHAYLTRGPRRPWAEVIDDYAARTGQTVGWYTAEPDPAPAPDDEAA